MDRRVLPSVDRVRLRESLHDRYDDTEKECRVVARAAGDLADTGRYESDIGAELSVEQILGELEEAPDGYGVVQRWNWWIGSLEVAYGGYDQFRVRRWTAGES